MTVAGSGEKWRWADPQGIQRVIHTDELRSALASGALPPYTLVWKAGMSEWVPAYQAAELATLAISAQQGLTLNVPPPPLAIIAAQAEFEHRSSSFDDINGSKDEEAPEPPVQRYEEIAASVPAHVMQAARAAQEQQTAALHHAHAPGHAHAPAAAPPAAAAPAPAPATAPALAPAAPPPAHADVASQPTPDLDDDNMKTWVMKPADPAVVALAQSAVKPASPATSPKPPPVAPKPPTPPKPPITAPPRATPSVPPRASESPPLSARPDALQVPPSAPDASKLPPPSHPAPLPPPSHPAPRVELAASGQLPPLPGALRSAPPPPPPPASRRPTAPLGAANHGLPAMPHAPLPVPNAARLDAHGPLPIAMPPPHPLVPLASPPPLRHGNGDATPLAPRASAPPLPPPTGGRSSAPPSLHDLPAFPLDEIEPDDVEEDEESEAANHRSVSDPVELPMRPGLGSKVVDGMRDVGESLRPIAQRAKQRIGPLAGRAKDKISPLAGRTKNWFTGRVAPKIEEGFAYVKANPKDPKVMLGLGGAALLILLLLIAVAAATGSKGPDQPETTEATESKSTPAPAASLGAAKTNTAAAVETHAASSAACRLTKEASRLASKASKDVPLEIAMSSTGDRARIGFATDAGLAQGLAVDLATFKVTQEFSAPVKGKARAVVPLGAEGKATFVVNSDGPGDKIHAWRTLSSQSLLVIGWAGGAISVGSQATDTPVAVWPLEGDDVPDAIRVASAGDLGQAVVFRRQGQIFGGMIDRDQKPRGDLARIAGAGAPSGSPVGTPVVATNPHAVAVAFADRASASEPWGVRIGSVPLGSMPTQTRAFAVPSGGPGGPAIAPALAGLPDGRWLLLWTEGSSDHDVRVQTLDAELHPKGSPFAVSHEGSNAGQGAVALAAGQGLIAYLTLTDQGYELWGAAVDCR